MGQVTRTVGSYTLNQVDYQRSARHGDYDIVCQVKQGYLEICHCTWHPDGTIHCKDRHKIDTSPSNCPCYKSVECLRD